MIINPINIGHYLMDRGHLTPDQLVIDKFTVHQNGRRNNNYIVNKNQNQALFIKQVRTFEAEKTETLKREATCYWLAQNESTLSDWSELMPEYVDFDYVNHLLISKYYSALPVEKYLLRTPQLKTQFAENLAKAIAGYHNRQTAQLLKSRFEKLFPAETPFVIKLGHNMFASSWRVNETYQKELLELIKSDEDHLKRIQSVADEWKVECLIHGDLKFQNLLIDENENLRIVDWETCDLGDPCWDIAAVFHSYLFAWMMKELKGSDQSNGHQTEILEFELSIVQNQLAAFWTCYVAELSMNRETAEQYLLKSIRFCALKLLHTSFEITNQSKKTDHLVASVLQLSLNILKDPQESRVELLKIPEQ